MKYVTIDEYAEIINWNNAMRGKKFGTRELRRLLIKRGLDLSEYLNHVILINRYVK